LPSRSDQVGGLICQFRQIHGQGGSLISKNSNPTKEGSESAHMDGNLCPLALTYSRIFKKAMSCAGRCRTFAHRGPPLGGTGRPDMNTHRGKSQPGTPADLSRRSFWSGSADHGLVGLGYAAVQGFDQAGFAAAVQFRQPASGIRSHPDGNPSQSLRARPIWAANNPSTMAQIVSEEDRVAS